jgi:putative endonuclease
MATHNELGKRGELLAREWLVLQGFAILYLNWRHRHLEVDIIASKEKILHFIEVKARSSNEFGRPEESVDRKKIINLMKASEEFQYQNPGWQRIQYDVLSIDLRPTRTEFFLIEDVFI